MHHNTSVQLALKKQRISYVNGFKRYIKPFGTVSIEKYEYDIWMELKDALNLSVLYDIWMDLKDAL